MSVPSCGGVASSGVAGDVAWSYNAEFVATSETVFDAVGAQSVAFGYDNFFMTATRSGPRRTPARCSWLGGYATMAS